MEGDGLHNRSPSTNVLPPLTCGLEYVTVHPSDPPAYQALEQQPPGQPSLEESTELPPPLVEHTSCYHYDVRSIQLKRKPIEEKVPQDVALQVVEKDLALVVQVDQMNSSELSAGQVVTPKEVPTIVETGVDDALVQGLSRDLNDLLVFAGVLSVLSTAIILQSLKSLQPDPTEERIRLLRSLLQSLDDSNPIQMTPFSPSIHDIATNACFVISLCCSFTVAFALLLGKQWLSSYERSRRGSQPWKSPPAGGQEWQEQHEDRAKSHLGNVVKTSRTLLQSSAFFFAIGLLNFLGPMLLTVVRLFPTSLL